MKSILKNNKRAQKKIDNLPKIYIIGCWARWGVREFPFVKLDENREPWVYNYNDHNGQADQWELVPLSWTTTGTIYDWTFSKDRAEYLVKLFNEVDGLEVD